MTMPVSRRRAMQAALATAAVAAAPASRVARPPGNPRCRRCGGGHHRPGRGGAGTARRFDQDAHGPHRRARRGGGRGSQRRGGLRTRLRGARGGQTRADHPGDRLSDCLARQADLLDRGRRRGRRRPHHLGCHARLARAGVRAGRPVGERPDRPARPVLAPLRVAGLWGRRPDQRRLLRLRSRGGRAPAAPYPAGDAIPHHVRLQQSGVERRRLCGGAGGGAIVGGPGRDAAVRPARDEQHQLPLRRFRAPRQPRHGPLRDAGRHLGSQSAGR